MSKLGAVKGVAIWAVLTGFALAVAGGVTLARAQDKVVNVYSYRQPFLIRPFLDVFEKETGIRVNTVFATKGMVERLKREGRNSPADLILTVDIGRLHEAVEADVLQGVSSPTLERNVPSHYRHPDGLWYGLTVRSRVIMASRERVSPDELSTHEALAEPRWKGRFCTRSSQHPYNVALLASLIAHHGEEWAEDWARGVKNNLARKPQGNDRAQVKAVYEGVCDIALVNSYYMGKMLQDEEQSKWANAVFIHFPNQQGRGAHVNISGAGVTKAAPHKADAVKLLEFLSGPLAQQMYAEQNYEYPVNPEAEWSGLLKSWGEFKADDLSLATVAEYRDEAIKVFDRVGFP